MKTDAELDEQLHDLSVLHAQQRKAVASARNTEELELAQRRLAMVAERQWAVTQELLTHTAPQSGTSL